MKTKIFFAGVIIALFSGASLHASESRTVVPAETGAKSDTVKNNQDPRLQGLEIRIRALNEAINSLEDVIESEDLPEESEEKIRKRIEELEEERDELKEKRDKIRESSSRSDTTGRKGFEMSDDYLYWEWGKKDKRKKKDKERELPNFKTRLFGFDLGFNTHQYTGNQPKPAQVDSLELSTAGSYTIKLHLLQSGVNLVKHHLYLTYSLTFDWQRYGFANSITLQPRTKTLSISSESFNFDKNALTAVYLGVPLMLHYETRPRKRSSFHIAAGGFGYFLIDSYTKQKSFEEGKVILHDRYNLNEFQYGVVAQIGYHRFNLFGQYAFSQLFDKAEGPPMSNLNFGIRIVGFHW